MKKMGIDVTFVDPDISPEDLDKEFFRMRETFDTELSNLNSELIEMGGRVEAAIKNAVKSLEMRDKNCTERAREFDREIDEMERSIERRCLKLLLRQQPVANDLRFISTALKIITDMERIGDQAADIADLSKYIDEKHVEIPPLIGKMAEMTVNMVTESVDAFVKRDLELCRKVIDDDDQVDDAFNQIKEELAELMYRNLDAKAGLDLLMTAKYMERIGDHAVNIAEWVEYAITGEHRNDEHQMGG